MNEKLTTTTKKNKRDKTPPSQGCLHSSRFSTSKSFFIGVI